ncbi:hypothetical protein RUND412_000816 [Rhizina undulata]
MANQSIFNAPLFIHHSDADNGQHSNADDEEHISPAASPSPSPSPSPQLSPEPEPVILEAYEDSLPPESSDEDDYDSDKVLGHWGDHQDTKDSVLPHRRLLASLDWEHHRNLGAHLYSAHLIKRREEEERRKKKEGGEEKDILKDPRLPKKKRKISDTHGEEDNFEALDEDGEAEEEEKPEDEEPGNLSSRLGSFIDKPWTAWPLHPQTVPRERDHLPRQIRSPSSRRFPDLATYSSLHNTGTKAPSEMLEGTLIASFLRQAKSKTLSRPTVTKKLEPAADDDISEHMLRPVVRNVITNLDALLTGLYHERKHYYEVQSVERKPPTDKRKRDSSADDESSSNELQKSQKTPQKKRRFPAPEPLREEYLQHRLSKIRPRDWSTVLGAAAITGWDEATVQETGKICSSLFGQDMMWRKLRESDGDKKARRGEVWSSSRGPQNGRDRSRQEDIENDGFLEPVRVRGKRPKPNPRIRKRLKEEMRRREEEGVSDGAEDILGGRNRTVIEDKDSEEEGDAHEAGSATQEEDTDEDTENEDEDEEEEEDGEDGEDET